MYRRTDEAEQVIAISPVEGCVLASIGEPRNGVVYQAANWWATREDAQAILDAHDQIAAWDRASHEPCRRERLLVALMIASCVALPIEGAVLVWALLRPGLHLPALAPALAAGWAVAVVCLHLFGAGRRQK